MKNKKMKSEDEFERQLFKFAPVEGCYYIKIPDTKMINKHNRKTHRELKRPFDGVLVTPNGNFCIECKYGYGKLSEHQAMVRDRVDEINNTHYVFRKKVNTRKNIVVYSIEKQSERLFQTTNILKLFRFFNVPTRWGIESETIPSCWQEKIRFYTYKDAKKYYGELNAEDPKGKHRIIEIKPMIRNYKGPFKW